MGRRGHTKIEASRCALLGFFFAESLCVGAQASVLGDIATNGDQDQLRWLTWDVPAGCPTQEELARRIEAIIGRPVGAEPAFAVVASVTEADAGFHLKLSITHDSEVGVREVAFQNCAEAFEFASIAAALAIDPGRNWVPSEEPMQQSGLAPTIAPAEDGGSEPALPSVQSAQSESLLDEASTMTPPSVALAPTKKEAPAGASPAQTRAQPERRKRPSSWFARGGLNFSTGLLPQAGFGPTMGGGHMFGLWALWADITFLPGSTYELDQAFSPVSMRWLGGTLGACRLVRLSSLSGGPCMRVQVGGLTGREEAADAGRAAHEGTGFFLGILAGLEGRLAIVKQVQAFASASASFPIVADDFVLSDGTLVYRPGLGFQASLGLMYFF